MLQIKPVNSPGLAEWFISEVIPLEPMLVRFLSRNWRNQEEVRDILQEVYVRVYESAATEIPLAIKPFLFTVARNLLIDRVRKMNVVPIEAVADFEKLNVVDNVPSPEEQTSAREELRELQRALDNLPLRCRQIVIMRKIDGLSQREVAHRLGTTEEVVESQTAKAVRLLSQSMHSQRVRLAASSKRFFASRRQSFDE